MSATEPPSPRANPCLIGHEPTEALLRRLADSNKLPHALLVSGPRGIGKATLAFRLARFVLSLAGEGAAPDMFGEAAAPTGGSDLSIAPESGVFRRVASSGHADLLTIERTFDPRRKRMRSEIVIDDVREIGAFLHLTSAEGGWRVVIVDGADALNRNAANALLKVLEEPPQRALLVLVAEAAGALLPTIRSRCRHVKLTALPRETVRTLLARYRLELNEADRDAILDLADGSIGRALELAGSAGVELHRTMLSLLSPRPGAKPSGLDALALHGFADRLARADAEDAYRATAEMLCRHLADRAVAAARGGRVAEAARLARLRDDIADAFARADGLNLDRKQTILGAFFAIDRSIAADGSKVL